MGKKLFSLISFLSTFLSSAESLKNQVVPILPLMHLRQGSSVVGLHVIQFKFLASELSCNDEDLQASFYAELSSHIKDTLAGHDLPTSLVRLVSLSSYYFILF